MIKKLTVGTLAMILVGLSLPANAYYPRGGRGGSSYEYYESSYRASSPRMRPGYPRIEQSYRHGHRCRRGCTIHPNRWRRARRDGCRTDNSSRLVYLSLLPVFGLLSLASR